MFPGFLWERSIEATMTWWDMITGSDAWQTVVSCFALATVFYCLRRLFLDGSIKFKVKIAGFTCNVIGAPPKKRALLVGINKYENARHLSGCVNDACETSSMLEATFGFKCLQMLDSEATRANIIYALKQCINATRRQDTFLFFFAGHGSEIVNPEKHNAYNETIVPVDGRKETVPRDITDDELQKLLAKARSMNIGLIFDSCHSGDITRDAEYGTRGEETEGIRGLPMPSGHNRCVQTAAAGAGMKFLYAEPRFGAAWLKLGNYVVLSACRDRQESQERSFAGVSHGLLTYHLLNAIRELDQDKLAEMSWRDVYLAVQRKFEATRCLQQPQLEGQREWQLFGNGLLVRPRLVLTKRHVDTNDQRLRQVLFAGELHGVSELSKWDLYEAGAVLETLFAQVGPEVGDVQLYKSLTTLQPTAGLNRAAPVKANANLETVGADISLVEGEVHGTAAEKTIFARCISNYFNVPITVMLDENTDCDQPAYQQLFNCLKTSSYLKCVFDRAEAHYAVRLNSGYLAFSELIDTDQERPMQQLQVPLGEWPLFASNVDKLAFARGLLRSKPAVRTFPGMFRLVVNYKQPGDLNYKDLELIGAGMEALCVREGTSFRFCFSNDEQRLPMHVAVLYIDGRCSVRLIHPLPGGELTPIAPGHSLSIPTSGYRRFGVSAESLLNQAGQCEDTLRLIVTDRPVDFAFLQQEGIIQFHDHGNGAARSSHSRDIIDEDETLDCEPLLYFVFDCAIRITPNKANV